VGFPPCLLGEHWEGASNRFPPSLRKQIRALGRTLIVNGIANSKVNAVDKSMVKAQGPLWHTKDRKKGIVPAHLRNVDRDSEWGYSRYRGWVQGYAIHLLCSATPGFVPVPLDADAATANVPENSIFESMIDYLHNDTKYIVADSGYDDIKLTKKCESRKNDTYITRRLIVPMEKYTHTASHRLPYIRFFKSERGQRLFRLRKITVEPMFDILKSLFSLEPVWMKGKKNVQPLLLLCVFAYQLLLLFNFVNGRSVSHVKYIIDGV
jgi:hypothetical protein